MSPMVRLMTWHLRVRPLDAFKRVSGHFVLNVQCATGVGALEAVYRVENERRPTARVCRGVDRSGALRQALDGRRRRPCRHGRRGVSKIITTVRRGQQGNHGGKCTNRSTRSTQSMVVACGEWALRSWNRPLSLKSQSSNSSS